MRSRRDNRQPVDIWPGFVDALSTLLLAVIFMLVVFVLGQFFLSQLLRNRDVAMRQMETSLEDAQVELQLEQDSASALRRSLSQVSADLQTALADRDAFSAAVTDRENAISTLQASLTSARADRDASVAQRTEVENAREASEAAAANLRVELEQTQGALAANLNKIEGQLAELASLRRDIEALSTVRQELEGRVAELSAASQMSETARQRLVAELGTTRDRTQQLEAELAEARERTVLTQREIDVGATEMEELQRRLATSEQALTEALAQKDAASAETARLQAVSEALTRQIASMQDALADKDVQISGQASEITDLGRRLNVALASEVEELSRSRSEFFGKLRRVLGDRENVRIVGDRFVFQSEVLFGSGEAEIGAEGRTQLQKLATAFKEITADLPDDLPWVLQVDGHTDRRPISSARFPSNWELSTARAISVARFLIEQGIPPERVAARGFAEFQPLEAGESDEELRRNRRIEVKLTTR